MPDNQKRTFLRLCTIVERSLADVVTTGPDLPKQLLEADDHGLLEWCLHGAGQTLYPFADLRKQQPEIWQACLNQLEASIAS